jgi:hypothetical protein
VTAKKTTAKKKTAKKKTAKKKTAKKKKKSSGAKTKPTRASVNAFLAKVADETRRADCQVVLELMRDVTGEEPKMWGASIVGFGIYRYVYASGHSGEWPLAGFSPRKNDLTLYVMAGFDGAEELLARLGPHKTGKSCLYLKRLADVNLRVLRQLVRRSVAEMKRRHPD